MLETVLCAPQVLKKNEILFFFTLCWFSWQQASYANDIMMKAYGEK